MRKSRWDGNRRPYISCDCGANIFFALSKGPYICFIDPSDADVIGYWNWGAFISDSGNVYAGRIAGNPKRFISLHRLVMGNPPEVEIDHRNGWGLYNCKLNLREASRSQNRCNMRKMNRKNTTGFKGVSFNKRQNRYVAYIRSNGVMTSLGTYETAEEAARVYDAASIKIHGEFSATNWSLGRFCK